MSSPVPPIPDQPLVSHLAELRNRVTIALLGSLALAICSYFWATQLFDLLTTPLRSGSGEAIFIGTGPAEAFIVKMKVAAVAGLLLASPLSFYELWRFIEPGLLEQERRFALPFVLISTAFFLCGVIFCFELVLPVAFSFFEDEYKSIGVQASIKIGEYLSFVLKLLLVFGVVFELPILAFFLARLGLLTHTWLIKQGRVAVVFIFIIAAILTPPDVVSQLLLAAPLCIIYGLSIAICYYFGEEAPAKRGDRHERPIGGAEERTAGTED